MFDPVELLFLGTGTSAGVPMIGCKCPVCLSPDPHDKRTRPSVLISYNNTRVLVDTTPELRLQCLANNVDHIDAIVFTHGHADHVFGLDDVRRFNAISGKPLDVWADDKTFELLNRSFEYAFKPADPNQKVFRPHLVRHAINGPFEINGVRWQPIPLLHGPLSILGFRVGNLAYCTDVSRIPEASFDLLGGLDVLVLDALAPNPHNMHFSLPEALQASGRIKAKQTYFTHIGHLLSHAGTNATLPQHIRLAYDGQRVTTGVAPL